jgi:hypothetical protein
MRFLILVLFAIPVQAQQYVITRHTVVPAHDLEMQRDVYTIKSGRVILKVRYEESQTSSWPGGKWDLLTDGIEKYLHFHSWVEHPDLSLVPALGTPVNRCVISRRDHDGDQVIAVQPTPASCFTSNGSTLHLLVKTER